MGLECSVPRAVPVTSGSICMEGHVQLEKIPMHGNASKTQESCERAARGNIKNGEAKE